MSLISVPTPRAIHSTLNQLPTSAPGRSVLSLTERLRTALGWKLFLALALNAWIAVPYFTLQRHVFFPITPMPETSLDRLIPFADAAACFYLSLYVAVLIPPLLFVDQGDLHRHCGGVVLIGLVSACCFLFLPTSTARPVAGSTGPVYQLVLATDTPLNACPSLHASLAVFTAPGSERLLRKVARPWSWRALTWTWALAILAATLLTKQHVVLDLAAGSLLALGVAALVWRKQPRQVRAGYTANVPTQAA